MKALGKKIASLDFTGNSDDKNKLFNKKKEQRKALVDDMRKFDLNAFIESMIGNMDDNTKRH